MKMNERKALMKRLQQRNNDEEAKAAAEAVAATVEVGGFKHVIWLYRRSCNATQYMKADCAALNISLIVLWVLMKLRRQLEWVEDKDNQDKPEIFNAFSSLGKKRDTAFIYL